MTHVTDLGLSEADTRAKLIDPAIHQRGWTEGMIRREETAGSIEIIGGKARHRSRGGRLHPAPQDRHCCPASRCRVVMRNIRSQ
ncbi:MAG: hypothetical protein WAT67_13805 [Candidatus Contendobacter sp.]